MNVIANRRSVRRGIFVAEYRQDGRFARGGRQHVWNQMRFRLVMLPETLGRARSIEISQRHKLHPVGAIVGIEHSLQKDFRPAVRIYRPLRAIFRDRHLRRFAVGRARRGKHDAANSRAQQMPEKSDSLLDVILKILCRLPGPLAPIRKRRKVHAGFNRMLGSNPREQLAIARLAFVKGHARIESAAMPAREIVEHHNVLAFVAQYLSRDAPDIARAAGNKNRHSIVPLLALAKSSRTPPQDLRQNIRWSSFTEALVQRNP